MTDSRDLTSGLIFLITPQRYVCTRFSAGGSITCTFHLLPNSSFSRNLLCTHHLFMDHVEKQILRFTHRWHRYLSDVPAITREGGKHVGALCKGRGGGVFIIWKFAEWWKLGKCFDLNNSAKPFVLNYF